MRIDRKKAFLAVAISAVLFGALLWVARSSTVDLSKLDPALIGSLVCVYIMLTMSRGLLLRALSPSPSARGLAVWFRLAARHQVLFSLTPSGAGDIGFPYLLHLTTGLPAAEGVRIIAQYRLRDTAVLASLGAVGAISTGLSPVLGTLALMASLVLIWFVDDVATLALKIASANAPAGRVSAFLKSAIPEEPVRFRTKLQRTGLSCVTWALASSGVALAFSTCGHPLNVGETLLVLVMINAIGAIAISFAGLGVSEFGVAGALIAMGTPASEAASIAIIARPLMLVAMITGSLALDFLSGLAGRICEPSGASRQ